MLRSTAERLDLPKILEMIKNNCTSAVGKDMVNEMRISTDILQVAKWQEETTEATEILRLYPDIPMGGIRDIRKALKRAKMDGILEPSDFLNIADTLRCARRLKKFITSLDMESPHMKRIAGELATNRGLEEKISDIITQE